MHAFQPGPWAPPGLQVETPLYERCAPGVGKRTVLAIIEYYGINNLQSQFFDPVLTENWKPGGDSGSGDSGQLDEQRDWPTPSSHTNAQTSSASWLVHDGSASYSAGISHNLDSSPSLSLDRELGWPRVQCQSAGSQLTPSQSVKNPVCDYPLLSVGPCSCASESAPASCDLISSGRLSDGDATHFIPQNQAFSGGEVEYSGSFCTTDCSLSQAGAWSGMQYPRSSDSEHFAHASYVDEGHCTCAHASYIDEGHCIYDQSVNDF